MAYSLMKTHNEIMTHIHKERIRLASLERERKRREARALAAKTAQTRSATDQKQPVQSADDILLTSSDQNTPQTASPTREDATLYLQVSERLRANWSVDLILHNLSISKDKLDKLCALYKTTLPELIARCQELGSRLIRLSVQRRAEAGDVRAVELLADLILRDKPKKDFASGYTLAELKELRDELKRVVNAPRLHPQLSNPCSTLRIVPPEELSKELQCTSENPSESSVSALPSNAGTERVCTPLPLPLDLDEVSEDLVEATPCGM